MPQRSAGILLYRLTDAAPEVLPVHPGGPFRAKNDDGRLVDPGQNPIASSRQETARGITAV